MNLPYSFLEWNRNYRKVHVKVRNKRNEWFHDASLICTFTTYSPGPSVVPPMNPFPWRWRLRWERGGREGQPWLLGHLRGSSSSLYRRCHHEGGGNGDGDDDGYPSKRWQFPVKNWDLSTAWWAPSRVTEQAPIRWCATATLWCTTTTLCCTMHDDWKRKSPPRRILRGHH